MLLVLAVMATSAATTPALAAPPVGTPPVVLEDVALGSGHVPSVRLRLSRPAEPVTKTLPAADGRPPRVYVDIPGAVVAGRVARAQDGTGNVRAIRVGQFDPSTARVVLELAAPRTVALDREGRVVTIRLRPAPADGAAPRPDVVPAPERSVTGDGVASQLRREIAAARAAGDVAGAIASYATWGSAVASRLDTPTRAAVADSLVSVGLIEEAARVLGDEGRDEAPVLRIARAELALASGDIAVARQVAQALAASPPSGMVAEPLARLRARVALADGDLETARAVVEEWPDPAVATDVMRASLAAGAAAAAARSWDRARSAYEAVLAAEVDGATRMAAAAGLARVAFAQGDGVAAGRALDVLRTMGTPLLRRAAATLASEEDVTAVSVAAEASEEDDGSWE